MDKLLQLLERHVQWFALAFGLLFVGWMSYVYLAYSYLGGTPPLSAKVGNVQVVPGELDKKIYDEGAKPLEEAMKGTKVDAPVVVNVPTIYDRRISEGELVINNWQLAGLFPHQAPGNVPTGPGVAKGGPIPDALPNPPPALPGPSYTRWTVMTDGSSRRDIAYFTGVFKIDAAALSAEMKRVFQGVNLPLNQLRPEFTRVYLWREEMLPDGKWGEKKEIASLPIAKLMDYPGEKKGAVPQKQDWFAYKDWMEKNQTLLIKPPFVPTAPDALPYAPPTDVPAPAPATGGQAPATPAPAQPRPAPVGNGAAGGPVVNQNIDILVHDATLKEGKTYRYALTYRLFNTVYDKQQLAAPKIVDIFDVPSPDPTDPKIAKAVADTLWTAPITPEPIRAVFVTRVNLIATQVQFTVFIWKDGHWSMSTVKGVMPGDAITSSDKLPSGFTLVDVRKDPKPPVGAGAGDGSYVLIMDDGGAMTRRDKNEDEASPDLTRLKKLSQPGNAPAAAAQR